MKSIVVTHLPFLVQFFNYWIGDDDGWSSYDTTINGVTFVRLLELIGFGFTYDINGNIDEYKFKRI